MCSLIDMQNEVETLIQRYRSAMDSFSLDQAIGCTNLPAIFVENGKVTVCKSMEELEKAFRWIFVLHRKRGYKRAECSIKKIIDQSPQGFITIVRWLVYGQEEELIWDFEASYNLFASEEGLRIAVFTAHT